MVKIYRAAERPESQNHRQLFTAVQTITHYPAALPAGRTKRCTPSACPSVRLSVCLSVRLVLLIFLKWESRRNF